MSFNKVYKELKKLTRKNYGRKCKEFCLGCSVCHAYLALDIVKEQVLIERIIKKESRNG